MVAQVSPIRPSQGPLRSRRQEYDRRLTVLENQFAAWRPHYQIISDNVMPRRSRFYASETNRGTMQNLKIIDNTATLACRTSAGGMMTNVTSPSSPWFKLSIKDPRFAEDREIADWMSDCEEALRMLFSKSNFYTALSDGIYEDMFAYGTACMLMEEDEEYTFGFEPLLLGEYYLATNSRGGVTALYRRFYMSVADQVDKFGASNVSPNIREAYQRNDLDRLAYVIHVIEPAAARYEQDRLGKQWKFTSRWYDYESRDMGDRWLREGGYDEWPVISPRWSLRPGDAYGRSPVMDCIGDIRALQQDELRYAEAQDKVLRPALVGPQVLEQQGVSLIPGTVNFLPNGSTGKLEPVAPVHQDVLTRIIEGKRLRAARIKETLFADLWTLFSMDERAQRQTAEEVRAKKEERLLLLGSPIERLNREMFAPVIERAFALAMRAQQLPMMPRRMLAKNSRGSWSCDCEMEIEFVSVLHQALKAIGISSIERTVGFVGNLAALDPTVVQKLDMGKVIEAHAAATGLPPHLLRSDAQVEQRLAAQRQAAQEAQMQAARAQAAAKGAPPAGAPAGPPPGGAPPIDPQALAVAAQADQGQPQSTNTLLNALGPQAAAGGFPGVGP